MGSALYDASRTDLGALSDGTTVGIMTGSLTQVDNATRTVLRSTTPRPDMAMGGGETTPIDFPGVRTS